MKNRIVVLILFFASVTGKSQNLKWAKSFGGPAFDNSFSTAIDSLGNLYTTGFFQATSDFDPGAGTYNMTSIGFQDIFITKINSSGNFIWAKRIGNVGFYNFGHSIASDKLGNTYVSGWFQGTVDFDPGSGVQNLTSDSNNTYDIFVLKLNPNGDFVWVKKMGGVYNDYGYSISLDQKGYVYTGGFFQGTADFDPGTSVTNLTSFGKDDAFISKLDTSGNFIWSRQFGGNDTDQVKSITIDSIGNVYVTGSFKTTADFDPGSGTYNLTSSGSNDIFIAKVNSSGNFLWAKRVGSTTKETGSSISTGFGGYVYSTGYFTGTVDFDPGSGTSNLTSLGLLDIYVLKLDSIGSFIWAKRVGGTATDHGDALVTDTNGNIYVTGNFQGSNVDFDPGTSSSFQLTANGTDGFVLKLNSSGNFIWAIKFGISGEMIPNSIVTQNGMIYPSGIFYGTIATGIATVSGRNDQDIFISKFNWLGNLIWVKGIGNGCEEHLTGTITDPKGNIYLTGTFNGISDFNPGVGVYNLPSSGGKDIFISKLDSGGSLVWAKKIGGTDDDIPYSITIDRSGFLYITGSFKGTVDFDPGTGVTNLSSSREQAFILKLDTSGSFIWAKNFGSAGSQISLCAGYSIVVDFSGNVFTTGPFIDTIDFDPGSGAFKLVSSIYTADIFVSKLNSSGIFQWAKRMGGTDEDWGNKVGIDDSGNVIVTGKFNATIDFDPGAGVYNLTSSGGHDLFIFKLTNSGNLVWARRIGGSSEDYGSSFVTTPQGGIYLIGKASGTIDFDPGTGTKMIAGSGFILKLSAGGNYEWAKRLTGAFSGSEFMSIVRDTVGNLYLAGNFSGDIDFDMDAGVNIISSGYEPYNFFVTQLNDTGGLKWARSIRGDLMINDKPHLSLYGINGVYLAGTFTWPIEYDSAQGSGKLVSAGSYDVFVFKLGPCLPSASTISGKDTICKGATESYSISAISGATSYFWSVPAGSTLNSGQNTNSISVTFGTVSGEVSVVPRNSCGMANPTSLKVLTVEPNVDIVATPATTVCAGSLVTLTGSGASSYTFSGGITSGVPFTINNTTKYYVIGTASYGCTNIDSVTITVNSKPYINLQPMNKTANFGDTILFIVNSVQSGASFQWQESSTNGFVNLTNGAKYSGTTNDTLIIKNITGLQNNKRYRCFATLNSCSDTSMQATLTVNCLPLITTQPTNQSINVRSNGFFRIVSSGINSIFRWQVKTGSTFIDIIDTGCFNGAANDTLKIYGTNLSLDSLTFRCLINNDGCMDTSNSVLLKINCVLSIIQQPLNKSVKVGDSVVIFFNAASFTTAIKYQWQVDTGTGFFNISNAGKYNGSLNDTLIIKSITHSMNNYKFRCNATDDGCIVTSTSALLQVSCILKITSQPLNRVDTAGKVVKFNINVSEPDAKFLWQVNSGTGYQYLIDTGAYLGSANDTLTLSPIHTFMDGYKFRCITLNDNCTDTSSDAILHVLCNLKVGSHPLDQSNTIGSQVLFIINVKGPVNQYNWQENSGLGFINLSNSSIYSGVDNDSLWISNLSYSQNNFLYRCVFSNNECTLKTDSAKLIVNRTGIKYNSNKFYFSATPNPATNEVMITALLNKSQDVTINLYNMNGKLIYSNSQMNSDLNFNKTIYLENYTSGVYLLQIVTDEVTLQQRIVKE